jgi:ComF family protein
LKDVILLFKYRDGEALGRDLACFAWGAVGRDEALWRDAETIIPVPLHPRRKRRRGFNQAAVLARGLAAWSGKPVHDGLLARRSDIPAQAGLNASERKRNVAGAFFVRRPEKAAGRVFLLVDDVYTTGSTAAECCRALLRAGARDVRVLTLARVQA